MNKTINQLDEIASAELTDEAVIFDLSESDTKKMTMQKAFNTMHKLSSTSVADSADELALYDSANNVTKKITKQNLLSEIQPPIIASSTTINGPAVEDGLYIKVIFTSAISGSDTVTPFEITYNGDSVPVKVMKSGTASDILAHETSTNVFEYLQAMITFEMVYSSAETAFILVGNPIVLSSSDYTIYADGYFDYNAYSTHEVKTNKKWIDGKPIYTITLTNDSCTVNNDTWTSMTTLFPSIANLSIANIVNAKLLVLSNTKNEIQFTTLLAVSKDWLFTYGITIRSNSPLKAIIEYTKTTD